MNTKQARQKLIKAEYLKRQKLRAAEALIDFEEMLSLVEFIGRNILEHSHNFDFSYAHKWCDANDVKFETQKTYLMRLKLKTTTIFSLVSTPIIYSALPRPVKSGCL